ncbi:DUF302 domain-containing protein [Dyella acidiphila]|uniref:DUF302 domain-containing protein n=1 Tax=Dyella acidiphila TaxID=2775866 RepID=A0ABR9GF79_9GAMM|nr:DUF302 domain-containing protein [Dyella acidiphila]MBE1162681.1 DUF302 domain-containing protein [Dyella acidiphila]
MVSEQSTQESAGLVTLPSRWSYADTLQRLLAALAEHGIKVFTTIDQQAEAQVVGLAMPPTALILFGNPKAGTPVMLANAAAGIDLPLKLLVTETEPGRVEVIMNTAAYVLRRHALPDALLANLAPAERLIAAVLAG